MVRYAAFFLLVACTVSPQPDPALEIDRIGYTEAELRGQPDAVVPGDAQLYVWSLFEPTGPTIVSVEGDGSFVVPWMPAEQETRLQVRVDDQRSPVVDIIRFGNDAVLRPVEECAVIDSEIEVRGTVGVETRITIPIRNDCAVVFELVPAESRILGLEPGFILNDLGVGFDIAPGETLNEVVVSYTPTAPGLHSDRLLVGIVGELRAIELYVVVE